MKKNSQSRLPQISCTSSSYWCPLAKYKPFNSYPSPLGITIY